MLRVKKEGKTMNKERIQVPNVQQEILKIDRVSQLKTLLDTIQGAEHLIEQHGSFSIPTDSEPGETTFKPIGQKEVDQWKVYASLLYNELAAIDHPLANAIIASHLGPREIREKQPLLGPQAGEEHMFNTPGTNA